ncbi:putative membrane protein [Apostasia shenzhenica]|uniref:Putative membrane protein n=1 Tax=Apostasia shenzhenica TaxID=1088818 RepID=A0A2I0A0W1_9ASPA|nr:putative membrane protein [Apostasia shenzhenica]
MLSSAFPFSLLVFSCPLSLSSSFSPISLGFLLPKCPLRCPHAVLLLLSSLLINKREGYLAMDVPTGFVAKLWSFISFLPFFFLLLALGVIKAAVIGPVVATLVFVGNVTVIIGLWPAHFFWTYYCVAKTKKLGLALKIFVLIGLPMLFFLWPLVGILGSMLVGIGYGYFTPLIATFEAVGEQVIDKLYHCFIDGCWSTLTGACTLVRDITDICFHSYFSFMDELCANVADDEKPLDIKLTRLPSCLLVSLLGVPIDVLAITMLALLKSPYMLLRGWQRLFLDLIGREGPFLETVCVPFAGLAIILWPLAVIGSAVVAFICSFFLGFYSGVIVYKENSLQMGLAYIVAVISLFDEYTNDLLYLRDGSCLPRPRYRKNQAIDGGRTDSRHGKQKESEDEIIGSKIMVHSEQSRTLKKAIQQLKPIQIWDWLFKSCELNGRVLLKEGLISIEDIEDCIIQGKGNKLHIRLPAWCILQCLLRSAKSDADGLLISDGVELTNFSWPKDRVLEWLFGPLLIMKEQIKGLHLEENEEACLRKLIITNKNEKQEDWDDVGFPSNNTVRRAQLQAILRRLQGMVASFSRMPTFRRRFNNLAKALFVEAMEAGMWTSNEIESKTRSKLGWLISEERRKQNNNYTERTGTPASSPV